MARRIEVRWQDRQWKAFYPSGVVRPWQNSKCSTFGDWIMSLLRHDNDTVVVRFARTTRTYTVSDAPPELDDD